MNAWRTILSWKPRLKGLVLLALLAVTSLVWPLSAIAGGVLNPVGYNSWELYVFGNGPVVWNILNSVTAMVNDSGYHSLLEFVGVIGIFGAAIVAGFDASKMPKMLAFALTAFFVLYISLDVTANIMVEDPVSGYTNVATGVPVVVGVPAAVISDVGHWLTEKVEQDFSIPNDLSVAGGNGFNLTNALVQDMTEAQLTSPYLRQSFAEYVSNCVMPELANGTLNASTILNSTDVWPTLQSSNQAILTPEYTTASPSGNLVSCSTAWSDIGNRLSADAPGLLSSNANAWNNTDATSFLSQALGSSISFLSNNSVTDPADQAVLQSASVNMLNASFQQSATLTGNNGMMTAMATAQAEQSQTSSWFTTARIFNDMMGYIYSVLQAFLFAITPILMAALLVPGFGFTILKNFAQVLLWLVLWEPMLAIVNYIIALYGQQSYGGVIAAAGGITDSNLPVMSTESAHMVLAAGFLGTMVPIIAWGLVKGSLAFSDFIMSGVSSSFSSSAGQQAATGNVTLDNQSANNDSFNHKDFAHSVGFGQGGATEALAFGNQTTNESLGGTRLSDAAGPITETLQRSSTSQVATSASSGTSVGAAAQHGTAERRAAQTAVDQATSHAVSVTSQGISQLSAGDAYKAGFATSDGTGSSTAASVGDGASSEAMMKSERGLSAAANLGTGLMGKFPGMGLGGATVSNLLSGKKAAVSEAQTPALAAATAAMNRPLTASNKGFIQGEFAKAESKIRSSGMSPAEQTVAIGGAIAAIAVGAFVGVDEIAGIVGAGAGAADAAAAALPEAAEAVVAGPAEAATSEALPEAAEGSAQKAAEPGDPPATSGKGAKKDSPISTSVAGGLDGGLSVKGSKGKALQSKTSAELKRIADQTQKAGQDSGGGTSTDWKNTVQTTAMSMHQYMSTHKSAESMAVDSAWSEVQTAQRNLAAAETANISNSSSTTISVPMTPPNFDAQTYTKMIQAAASKPLPVSETAAATKYIAETSDGIGSTPALSIPGSVTAGAVERTGGVAATLARMGTPTTISKVGPGALKQQAGALLSQDTAAANNGWTATRGAALMRQIQAIKATDPTATFDQVKAQLGAAAQGLNDDTLVGLTTTAMADMAGASSTSPLPGGPNPGNFAVTSLSPPSARMSGPAAPPTTGLNESDS